MNKYQEALDRIKTNYCVANSCNPFATDCDCPFQQDYEIVKNELEEYEQLKSLFREYNIDESNIREMLMIANMYKDKKTPKKPLVIKYKNSEHYFCPNCEKHRFGILDYGEYKNEWRKDSELTPYCPYCGEEIDWSDK